MQTHPFHFNAQTLREQMLSVYIVVASMYVKPISYEILIHSQNFEIFLDSFLAMHASWHFRKTAFLAIL